MSKHGKTKEEILRLISEGKTNLSEISGALGLAPSTVSKHLHDLESTGLIEPKDRSFARKWKHYKVNRSVSAGRETEREVMLNRSSVWKGATISVVAVLVVLCYLYFSGVGAEYIPISITDPPSVPVGTTALYLNYSSLEVHVVGGNSGGYWMPVNSSGRVDLMSLINESEVIGSAEIPSGAGIDMVRFNITSSSIVVDNATYDVRLASSSISAMVDTTNKLNSSSGVLLDFSPVVTEQYAQNSTPIFVLFPSLKAAVIPSPSGLSGLGIGNFVSTHARYQMQQGFGGTFAGRSTNLTVESASATGSSNSTTLDLSLFNNGNSNLTVYSVLVGEMQTPPAWNTTLNAFGNGYFVEGQGFGRGQWAAKQANSSLLINNTNIDRNLPYARNGSFRINLPRPVNSIVIARMPPEQEGGGGMPQMGQFVFAHGQSGAMLVVFSNGTMAEPSPPMPTQMFSSNGMGYTIPAHGSVTLTFEGRLFLGAAAPSGNYTVSIVTSKGIVQANVTS